MKVLLSRKVLIWKCWRQHSRYPLPLASATISVLVPPTPPSQKCWRSLWMVPHINTSIQMFYHIKCSCLSMEFFEVRELRGLCIKLRVTWGTYVHAMCTYMGNCNQGKFGHILNWYTCIISTNGDNIILKDFWIWTREFWFSYLVKLHF